MELAARTWITRRNYPWALHGCCYVVILIVEQKYRRLNIYILWMVVTKTATDEVNSPRLYVNTSTLQKHIKAWPNSNMVRKIDFNDMIDVFRIDVKILTALFPVITLLDTLTLPPEIQKAPPYKSVVEKTNKTIIINHSNTKISYQFTRLDFNDID